jgi:hypothetical protein
MTVDDFKFVYSMNGDPTLFQWLCQYFRPTKKQEEETWGWWV